MFDCMFDECPKDEEKCHLWWEIPWENQETGEVKMKKGCILSQDMGWPLIQTIVKAAHVSSEHASKTNNSVQSLDRTFQQFNALADEALKQQGIPTDWDGDSDEQISIEE